MTPGRVFPGPGWAWNVRYSSSSGSAAAAISASIAGRVFHELMKKEITEGPAGRGEEGARQNLNEHGGEFHPRSPSAPRVGVDFLRGIFCPFPSFFGPSPWAGLQPPRAGGAAHPPGPAGSDCAEYAAICVEHRRALADPRWQILSSLLNNSSPH